MYNSHSLLNKRKKEINKSFDNMISQIEENSKSFGINVEIRPLQMRPNLSQRIDRTFGEMRRNLEDDRQRTLRQLEEIRPLQTRFFSSRNRTDEEIEQMRLSETRFFSSRNRTDEEIEQMRLSASEYLIRRQRMYEWQSAIKQNERRRLVHMRMNEAQNLLNQMY